MYLVKTQKKHFLKVLILYDHPSCLMCPDWVQLEENISAVKMKSENESGLVSVLPLSSFFTEILWLALFPEYSRIYSSIWCQISVHNDVFGEKTVKLLTWSFGTDSNILLRTVLWEYWMSVDLSICRWKLWKESMSAAEFDPYQCEKSCKVA